MLQNFTQVLFAGAVAVLLSSGAAFAGAPVVQIPEPTSLALLATGIAGVAWVKFRRRK